MMFNQDDELPVAAINDTIREMLDKTSKIQRRGAVMVVDGQGELAGIITDADLRRAISTSKSDAFDLTTADIMTPDCKRVTEETLAAEAMAIFHKFRIDELPVVDADNKPVGLIDVQDIVAIKIVG
jgi:arabinose-5-phosphate isomerase